MFVYDIKDIFMVAMIFIVVMVVMYKMLRYLWIFKKYSKCPICGHVTGHKTTTEYNFGDQDAIDEFYCRKRYDTDDKSCQWNIKFKI